MGCGASAEEITIGVVTQRRKGRKSQVLAENANKEYEEKIEFLLTVPLFQRLPQDEHPVVASVCESCRFKRGDTIIRQGARGEEFFVIQTGQADVFVKKTNGQRDKIATLRAGDHFGEGALLRDEPRAATIVAASEVQALKITRSDFQSLGLHKKLKFGRRAAVSSDKALSKAKDPVQKSEVERKLIAEAIRTNENLWVFTNLEEKIPEMIAVMWKEFVKAGKKIITEGDLEADYFYIVQEGKFEVSVREDKLQGATVMKGPSNSVVVGHSKKGQSFGEVALLYCSPRAATVRALINSVVWVIDRAQFKDILLKAPDAKIQEYRGYLDTVPLLSALLKEERNELAHALVEMVFNQGENIIIQGETGNTFYIMFSGTVDVIKDHQVITTLEASVSRKTTQYFGEFALLEDESRTATVQVRSQTVRCLVLDRDSFQTLLGPLKEVIASQKTLRRDRLVGKEEKQSDGHALAPDRDKVFKQDLSYVGLLGVGGFSKVELWQHMVSGTTYALKSIDKGLVMHYNMEDTVLSEKKVLIMTHSPFIVKLVECFNSEQYLEILMEACLGGELLSIYSRKGLWGSMEHSRYYSAGTALALEHMHERRIVYRDLKPENVVLDDQGHMRITDLGLAKLVIGKTYTTCGTPEYFAPEVIALSGQTLSVDWWTLGIFLYELLCSTTPFAAAHPMQIYAKVMRGIDKNSFPGSCAGAAELFIKGLLRQHPGERLPARHGGIKNLKEHDFFAGFDWNAMKGQSLAPPYIPEVVDEKDLSNFFADPKDVPEAMLYQDPDTGWDDEFATVE